MRLCYAKLIAYAISREHLHDDVSGINASIALIQGATWLPCWQGELLGVPRVVHIPSLWRWLDIISHDLSCTRSRRILDQCVALKPATGQ